VKEHGEFQFKIHIGGITVATVTGNFTIHVNPAPPPPAPVLTPSAGALPDETVGSPATGSVAISGGTPPYSVAATGLPPGVSAAIGADGASVVLSGQPTLAGDATVNLVVTDSGV
jgi:hypothetical protein